MPVTWPDRSTVTLIEPATDDPRAVYWAWPVLIAPRSGSGAYGDEYDPVIGIRARIIDETTLVRNQEGQQVASSTRVQTPITLPTSIGVGSLVLLPPEFGGRETEVITVARHDGGSTPTPRDVVLALA